MSMESRERVEAVAGEGLRGDRYVASEETYPHSARELTLIEILQRIGTDRNDTMVRPVDGVDGGNKCRVGLHWGSRP